MIKVLIVDDESRARDIIRAVVDWKNLGMEIVGEAEDGQDALRKTEQLQPNIIITDIRMAGIDGLQLLRLLHERYPQIRKIVVSAYDDFYYAVQALRYNTMAYLLKPVNQTELHAVLQNCKSSLGVKTFTL
ncbi:response regulator [Paenibacillus oenotherae]|uniref:Response regulator n=1 Tax=Paenibacillus oenotherae TaxID=1435645 RepID=A0ABS7D699_9BACL|nr:response regulator [Paenibacillus oenotherae]MBW7475318.1 response regulator [Paenibacillus oenotherae]